MIWNCMCLQKLVLKNLFFYWMLCVESEYSFGNTFLKWFSVSMLFSHISVIRVTPVMSTPWFFSVIKLRVAGKNISINSGTRLMIRKAQSAAFFRMYAFGDFISLSTSDARSLAISGDAIAPRVHNARPMTNCVELFKSLLTEKENEDTNLPWKTHGNVKCVSWKSGATLLF